MQSKSALTGVILARRINPDRHLSYVIQLQNAFRELLFFFKNIAAITLLIIVFSTLNGLAVTPTITTIWIRIGPIATTVQLLSLGLLILYGVLT